EMLEPVVQHVDRAAKAAFGEASGEVAAARDEHGHAVELARQHQRLVARPIEIRAHALRVADDDDAVLGAAAGVAATEDGGTLAGVAQRARDESGHRRLGTAAGREIADTHHRAIEPALQVGAPRVERAAGPRGRGVGRRDQWTTRNGRTLPASCGGSTRALAVILL